DLAMPEIEVSTTPRNIPDEIVVDVTTMTMDTTITLGEVALPAGVIATADAELPVVTVLTMRTPLLDEEDVAAEADEEGTGEAARPGRGGGACPHGAHAPRVGLCMEHPERAPRSDGLAVDPGNPARHSAPPRHNVGAEVVELLAERHDAPLKSGRDNALV